MHKDLGWYKDLAEDIPSVLFASKRFFPLPGAGMEGHSHAPPICRRSSGRQESAAHHEHCRGPLSGTRSSRPTSQRHVPSSPTLWLLSALSSLSPDPVSKDFNKHSPNMTTRPCTQELSLFLERAWWPCPTNIHKNCSEGDDITFPRCRVLQ